MIKNYKSLRKERYMVKIAAKYRFLEENSQPGGSAYDIAVECEYGAVEDYQRHNLHAADVQDEIK